MTYRGDTRAEEIFLLMSYVPKTLEGVYSITHAKVLGYFNNGIEWFWHSKLLLSCVRKRTWNG